MRLERRKKDLLFCEQKRSKKNFDGSNAKTCGIRPMLRGGEGVSRFRINDDARENAAARATRPPAQLDKRFWVLFFKKERLAVFL
jgi:hypothetical protein